MRCAGLLIPIALILPFFAQSVAIASDWEFLVRGKNGNTFYIDKNSLRRQGDAVWYWTYVKYGTPTDGVTESVTFASGNCRTREYRLRSSTGYNAQRQIVDSFNDGDRGLLVRAIPDTASSFELDYVCRVRPL